MESKKDIRNEVLNKRNSIPNLERKAYSHNIYNKVVSHPFFLSAEEIYCYVNFKSEVETRDIITKAWELKKKVAVPKVIGAKMLFSYISKWADLKEGYYGILEPEKIEVADPQGKQVLVIMPGAVFDLIRNRIGYGKGYYDKYLTDNSACRTIAIAFSCQIVNHVPAAEHDIRPEILITEEGIYDDTFTE